MSWKTWSPFQSEELKRICAHMTAEEKRQWMRVGQEYGAWHGSMVATTTAVPTGLATGAAMAAGWPWIAIVCVFAAGMIAGTLVLRLCFRKTIAEMEGRMCEVLCNTEWARAQGCFQAKTMKLKRWPWQRERPQMWPGADR
ncbi:MAG: hypothetical protein L0Y44_07655 [Phycisphaerales bacterium]|nr:hypothetical protein [Phycisphaerales bacterium]MCI0676682.1 hypothetical protein [Phycisphaerales bacterium]